jgi:hypothetical protein
MDGYGEWPTNTPGGVIEWLRGSGMWVEDLTIF